MNFLAIAVSRSVGYINLKRERERETTFWDCKRSANLLRYESKK